MVDIIKVQQEILKSPLSGGGTLPDGRVYLSFDGVSAFVMLEASCKIDLKKIEQRDYNKYFSESANAKAVWATGTTKMLGKNQQWECAEFQTGDGELVYIQKKYLKYFDKKTSFRYSKNVLFAFDQHDNVCGLICTVRNDKK